MKKKGTELELLTDIGLHLFMDTGIQDGILMESKRYAKADNPLEYYPSKLNSYIMFLDANNLYG